MVGRVGRPHGIRGEVTVLPATDDPRRFAPGSELHAEGGRRLVVRSVSPYRDRGLVVGFEGVDDRNSAETLRGASLTVGAADRRPLEAGEFWPEDLVGLQAVSPAGEVLGEVVAVEFGEAQDRIVVATPDGRRVQVPFVDDLVGDPEEGTLVVDAPPGLFD